MSESIDKDSTALKQLARLFLKLGVISFGGPAAHIAMMEDEIVKRRKWISHEHFLDLLGATNLIPGPNSTEMAIHIGYVRAGWRGLIVAGICFIFPSLATTLILAYMYVAYGSLPQLQPFMSGIRPAVIAVILAAVLRLSKSVVKNPLMIVVGVLVVIMNLAGFDEILLLLVSGAVGLIWNKRHQIREVISSTFALLPLLSVQTIATSVDAQSMSGSATIIGLGLFFLKIGSILYGSGYVLVAFLQAGLVDTRHWLTQPQLFDAIAVGQFTPGPVLSTATFVGYLILGFPGAAITTIGIFLPAFVFVLIVGPFITKVRNSQSASGFLNGVNAASLGLMLAVTAKLATAALSGLASWFIMLLAMSIVIAWNINAAWIVLGSAFLGWLLSILQS
jgi:chromate transporter